MKEILDRAAEQQRRREEMEYAALVNHPSRLQ